MLIFVSKIQSFIIIALRFYLTGGILFNYFSGLLFNYIIQSMSRQVLLLKQHYDVVSPELLFIVG